MTDEKIDIVIPWVDSNDIEWQRLKAKYEGKTFDDRDIRFRDWDNLQYLFRGIEKFAPWVNNVYFITCGHLPKWLNTKHPKLKIVFHEEYIPQKYLPTFNSNTIELNLHRLEGLSERFILFNDDTFILKEIKKKDFFKKGLPRDIAMLNVHCYDMNTMYVLTPFINVGIINKYYNIKDVIKNNMSKWFNIKYGYHLIRNIMLLPCPRFPGFVIDHLPTAHLKSTFSEIWNKEEDLLDETSSNKFREKLNLNHWLMREWNIVCGKFIPRNMRIGKSYGVYESNANKLAKFIYKKKYKIICLNDTEMNEKTFIKVKNSINTAFNDILSERSEYEK